MVLGWGVTWFLRQSNSGTWEDQAVAGEWTSLESRS